MLLLDSLDHLVLTVADIEATCRFYVDILGMQAASFGAGRKSLAFGTQKINLHQHGQELEPKATRPTPGSADLCFLTQTPLVEVVEHLQSRQVVIVQGPVQRTGATGLIQSIYLRDPDGNLVEVSNLLPASADALREKNRH